MAMATRAMCAARSLLAVPFRSSGTAAAASSATGSISSNGSSSSGSATGPSGAVYELRTYSLLPAHYGEFLSLTNEKIGLRTAHSELTGYWTTELGGLNEVVHIWKYDSFKERLSVRRALAQDETWQKTYMNKITQWMSKQDNFIMHAVPWCPIAVPEKKGGVYELRMYTAKPGALGDWAAAFRPGLEARRKYSSPVGIWFTEIGSLNGIIHLWHYDSVDHRAEVRAAALADKTWVATVKATMPFLQTMQSKVMSPAPFSPLG